jgi:putative FmdB family regulatory protein
MPLYDYTCNDCDDVFEARHARNCIDPVTCPACESEHTRKLVSVPGVSIRWWNARASSEATIPKYLGPVRSARARF